MSYDVSREQAGGSESPQNLEPGCRETGESGSSSSSADRQVVESGMWDQLHHQQRLSRAAKAAQQRNSRKTTSVACQTDESEEFPSLQSVNDDASSSSSEGVLRLMIQNFRSMNDTVRGPSKKIHGVQWRIMVMPRQHMVQKKGTQKCLGFFLQCCPDAYSDHWSCQAAAELRLISQKHGIPHFTRKTNHNYTSKENDWGYSCFMTWADILDENQGYIKDDRVILEVTVTAELPKNILSKEEFQKTIQSWMDLAEMQFQRKCIDLAIEANSQALKFCGSRDAKIKSELEKQKTFFIERKVVESIQRIEKGKETTVRSDDDGLNQNALRQALTANNNRNMGRKNKTKKTKKTRTSPQNTLRVKDKPLTEKADVVMQKADDATTNIKEGRFNNDVMTNFKSGWNENCSVEQELYSNLYYQLENMGIQDDEEEPEWLINNFKEKEEMIMKYLASLSPPGKFDKESQLEQFKQINENVYEIEKRRKEVIERAIVEAALRNEKWANSEGTESSESDIEEFIDFPIEKLWEPGRQNYRSNIMSRLPRFFRHPRLLWLDDCISDRESVMSSDSDRQYDGSIKPKRSKLERKRELLQLNRELSKEMEFFFEDYDYGNEDVEDIRRYFAMTPNFLASEASMCEASVQTEMPQTPVNPKEIQTLPPTKETSTIPCINTNGRVVKKATSKKKAVSKACETKEPPVQSNQQTQQTVQHQTPTQSQPQVIPPFPLPVLDPVSVNQELQNSGLPEAHDESSKPVIPKVLPMEYAMKFFPESVTSVSDYNDGTPRTFTDSMPKLEDWSALAHALGVDLTNHFPDQVMTALSAVAMNAMNARRATSKITEIVHMISDRNMSKRIIKLLAGLCSTVGVNMDSIDHKALEMNIPQPQGQNLADISDDDWTTVYSKILNRECEADYMLLSQMQHLEEVRVALINSSQAESEEMKKMQQVASTLEQKYSKHQHQIKDMEKKLEDLNNSLKKTENNYKKELTSTKNTLTNEREKMNGMTKELKEKNKEIKRMEQKNFNLMSEKDDLQERVKQLQKELQMSQRKHTEELQKLKRDLTFANDNKKHLQSEINNRDSEIKTLQYQLDERSSTLEKLKQELKQEKQKSAQSAQSATAALERAKTSEIEKLTYELEAGVAILERAHSDASKHAKEMEEAANTRARNQTDMANYNNNKNEWNAIIEKITGLITKAKTDYGSHIEAINSGKALSALPKISVPKPPPPPALIKIPPIVSVEPTKPTPGVIGSRPHYNNNISPTSRAPGSPIQKPSNGPSASSPVRHLGAIGTRPNGVTNNSSSSNSESTSDPQPVAPVSNGLFLPWSDKLANINENITPSSSANLMSVHPPRMDQNWDEQNMIWGNSLSSSMNQYQQQMSQNRSASFSQSQGWPRQHSTPISAASDSQRIQNIYLMVIPRLCLKLQIDQELAAALTQTYMRENGSAIMRMTPDDIVEAIASKRMAEATRLPPGAAPGYLHNPLMGYGSTFGSMLGGQDNMLSSFLNGADVPMRPSTSSDKWSNGM